MITMLREQFDMQVARRSRYGMVRQIYTMSTG
jgi:hypothetical protein